MLNLKNLLYGIKKLIFFLCLDSGARLGKGIEIRDVNSNVTLHNKWNVVQSFIHVGRLPSISKRYPSL